jgi:hypothetical protein
MAGARGTGGGIAAARGGGGAAGGVLGSAGADQPGAAATCVGAGAGLVVMPGSDGGTGREAARSVLTAPIAAAERNHKPNFMSRLADPLSPTKKATVELTPIRCFRETIGLW